MNICRTLEDELRDVKKYERVLTEMNRYESSHFQHSTIFSDLRFSAVYVFGNDPVSSLILFSPPCEGCSRQSPASVCPLTSSFALRCAFVLCVLAAARPVTT